MDLPPTAVLKPSVTPRFPAHSDSLKKWVSDICDKALPFLREAEPGGRLGVSHFPMHILMGRMIFEASGCVAYI